MKLNRSAVSLRRRGEKCKAESVRISKEEALLYVWDLTQEVYSLTGDFDAESRLQRDVVSVTRK
ncbi:hypothetical protein [Chitinivibrio alkaliphilus]|uniref:Uncharacterized protein n=1 Tax=Chitinivibrio alkaliphilus ACht1 TaxID=1313304 RepID=U7D9H6_9BACT|nr:hypothetical protein [Chitinivibrio alkaliphilus]ERP39044.1 hypothetical protein CALK_0538 [Chitinivibrio alkaliphilus ACht1]